MSETIRSCYRGVAYTYFHPEDKEAKTFLDKLLLKAWYLGYSRSYFDRPNPLLDTSNMTIWEIGYCLKDVIDIKHLS